MDACSKVLQLSATGYLIYRSIQMKGLTVQQGQTVQMLRIALSLSQRPGQSDKLQQVSHSDLPDRWLWYLVQEILIRLFLPSMPERIHLLPHTWHYLSIPRKYTLCSPEYPGSANPWLQTAKLWFR